MHVMIESGHYVSSLLKSHGMLADPPTGCYKLRFQLHNPGLIQFMTNAIRIIAIEIMLLAITLLVLISSVEFDNNIGQTFSPINFI